MSSDRGAGTATGRVGSGADRLSRAWRELATERRQAALAALGLFAALFLPWYQETVIATGGTRLQAARETLTGWAAFSFVEAAVLLVAAGVLTLLFMRAEGRAFHLPGGDGWVITAAGFWTCLLIVWRIFDKQGTGSQGQFATTSGVEWGIFVALAVAALLTYSGTRVRAAHQIEAPLPGEGSERSARSPRDPGRPVGSSSARSPRDPGRPVGSSSAGSPRDPGHAPEPPRSIWPQPAARPPRPVPAEDPPTRPLHGSSRQPDDELTIPLQPEE